MPNKSFWSFNSYLPLVFFFDSLVALISIPLSYMLRYDSVTEPVLYDQITLGIYLLAFLIKLIAFRVFKVSNSLWRFTGVRDLVRIVGAQVVAMVALVLLLFVINRVEGLPRSVIFIDVLIGSALLGGPRLLYRALNEREPVASLEMKDVFLIGSGNAGAQLVKDAVERKRAGVRIAAIFDDDPRTHGRAIHGIKVVGGTEKIGEMAAKMEIRDVIIAIPSASAGQMRKLVDLCASHNLRVKTLPTIADIIEGKVEISNLRPINIDDLLARDPIELNLDQVNTLIAGKVIMVTGAGGSIGSELCKQILKFNPSRLVLFENCEFFMYRIEREIRQAWPQADVVPVIGDVRDSERIEWTLKKYRPHMIFHAAAYKHVPMMEANAREAVKTNVMGTALLAGAATKFGVERFVMISTDKAVNPTNVMGATKRVAEMVCLDQNAKGATRFSIIRFGNVLGSAGSVIPLFQDQIRRGGPVTVTHPEITRYFMSIPEATRLVLQACAFGVGGEIFVLEMGKPVKILDLAKDLIRLSGLEVDKDIAIEFTGLRPGEKLYEELLTDHESTQATNHDKVRIARATPNPPRFNELLERLILSVNEEQEHRDILRELVPEYKSQN